MFRTHVQRRTDHRGEACVDYFIGQLLPQGFGDSEVDHLDHRDTVVWCDQDIAGLEVAMNHPFLMSVLHGMADLNEQFQPLFGGQFVGIAIVGDLNATNEFHHKVRATEAVVLASRILAMWG